MIEKSPEQLVTRDVLVFVKLGDDYTKNIVDLSMSACSMMGVWGKVQLRLTKSLNIGKKPCGSIRKPMALLIERLRRK